MGEFSKHLWLKALGADGLPESIRILGCDYRLIRLFKHDFFAATGLYRNASAVPQAGGASETARLVVLKAGRTRRLLFVPLRFIGRWLAQRERRFYERLQGVAGVPAYLGPWQDVGLVHAYIDGHPLQRGESVNDAFFPKLGSMLDAIHQHDIAYVDLEKRANILVGDDGNPYLIDFQISYGLLTPWAKSNPVSRYILKRLQRSDRYHLLKHHRRHRPDQLSPAQLAASRHRPWYIQLHRVLFRPWTMLRRAVLRALLGDAWQPRQDDRDPTVGLDAGTTPPTNRSESDAA